MSVFSRNSNHVPSRAVRTPMLWLALVGGVAAHFPVVAQEGGLVLEEVIVTATKRETTLMDTGISISAFSSEKLQEFGIQNLDDLSANTPGLSISSSERIRVSTVSH
jgi:iron complex outermembrane receptor protein